MDLVEIWKNVLGELEVSISKANFTTWFKNTFIVDQKNDVFTIGVPTFFVEDWLKKKYLNDIIKAFKHQTKNQNVSIKFKVAAPSPEQVVAFDKNQHIHNPVDKKAVEKKSQNSSQRLPKNSTLNNDYRFDNFVVGPSNQLAYAAAEAVVNKPGENYNPLFIYGESGLGKTHLMQAVGNRLLENLENIKVLYVTSETFINDFISAVETGSGRAKDFKNRYRLIDVLLIDDIQFLSGKESTQEEFFHTFNHLHQNKKQVILTADRPPMAIKGLEKRLQTRFEGGMVADIGAPDLETRSAILKNKAREKNREISEEIINYIAENIKSSVRELEGALTKVLANFDLTGCEITIESVSKILNSLIEHSRKTITPDNIIRETCRYYKIPKEEVLGKKRNKEIVVPRQIVMYLLRHEASLSFPEIGREMGGKDHTTIMHGCNKIELEITSNNRLKEDVQIVREQIRQSLAH